ncbi:hypothetical protein L226DRAFT_572562 [Lentinus tigrinus ALCF2SS1-7]|uniref:uncharacterized protein n=1 Tax=Lentinus tigrinus ALCF2SS1-7 TaxID=1328758 RepID=UPI001165E8EE|nr:hypothetical protein L226DRAFT_572562 [Lentinus tigrinus ALCF2SS1-7]
MDSDAEGGGVHGAAECDVVQGRCFLAQDPRYLRFSVFEGGITSHYNLRVSNAKIAEELLEEINAHIPME